MKNLRLLAASVAIVATLSIAGCAPTTGPVVAPVTVDVNQLQGTTVEVALNQVININTGSLAVDSYTATIADPSILSFTQGKEEGGATFNPGLTPLKVGETDVTLKNKDGGIQPLEFTVKVTQ